MWVEETKNGKYKVGERYTDPLTGKRKKVSVTIEKDTKKAIKAAEQILNQKIHEKTSKVTMRDVTIKQFTDAYLKDQRRINKPSTVRRNEFAVKNVIELFGADTLADSLNAGYVRQVLLDSGKEKGTLNEFLARFKAIFRWGYCNDYIKDISFLAKLKLFKEDNPDSDDDIESQYLERDELEILLENMHVEKWRNLTIFLVLSGLRIGEALALTSKDVDLKNREISVSKTYDSNNRLTNYTPKTDSSTRIVYIQDELFPLMKLLKQNSLAESFATGCNLLFQEKGKEYRYDAYRKYLRITSTKYLDRHIKPHMLRHTHISLLAEELNLEEISRRVGHKDSAITRKVYLHVTKKMKTRERERIKGVKIL